MSGLWSFRETHAPLPCLSDAARSSLPTAAAAALDYTCTVRKAVDDTLIDDPLRTFSLTTDVDGAIEEVQNEWFERIVGQTATQASPYHLRPSHTEASPPEVCDSRTDACESLAPEDMEVVRGLLKAELCCGGKKVKSLARRRCPTVARSPVLHTARCVSQRKERQRLSEASASDDIEGTVHKSTDRPTDSCPKKDAKRVPWDSSTKHTPCRISSAPKTISRAFVERVERGATQRRAARLATSNARLPDTATGELPQPQNAPKYDEPREKRSVLQYDALPLDVQVALLSLETSHTPGDGLSCYSQSESIANQWYVNQLKKKVWRRWCYNQNKQPHSYEQKAMAIGVANCSTSVRSPLGVSKGLTLTTNDMQLLRWYFVLWVAALVENTRHQSAVTAREKTGMT